MNSGDLLRPTLTAEKDVPALYSSQGFFLSAFFGGPVGALVYGLANSHKLGRLRQEALVLLGIGAASLALFVGLHESGVLTALSGLLGGHDRRNLGIIMRVIGLLTFGAIYLVHRPFHRAASVAGTRELPGWAIGTVAIVVGWLASGAFLEMVL